VGLLAEVIIGFFLVPPPDHSATIFIGAALGASAYVLLDRYAADATASASFSARPRWVQIAGGVILCALVWVATVLISRVVDPGYVPFSSQRFESNDVGAVMWIVPLIAILFAVLQPYLRPRR